MRSLGWLPFLTFPLLAIACGHAPARPVATTGGVVRQEPCRGSEPALSELEALRHTHAAGEDLATMLRAERGLLEAGRTRRASAPASNAIFADAEQDAEKRAGALERYAAAVEETQLATHAEVRRLENYCAFERLFSKILVKKPALNAPQKRLDCERFSQIREGVRWDDAASVTSLADGLDPLKTLPQERTKATADRARMLSVALRGAAADRAIFMARQDVVAGAEQRATAMFGQCHAEPAAMPALIVSPEQSQRALTVIITAKPPRGLGPHFERAALSAPAEDAPLYRGIAMGRFGSGFIIAVKGEGGARETFVVTNRHVADLASSLSIKLESGATFEATPVFIDPGYDLAVLAPKDPAQKIAAQGGFDLAGHMPVDGDEVTAMGYPGMMGEPSFQLTKGHVSNASLVFPEGKLVHVQHTAAIDPGSSGGPLLGAHREVLGVNTFKLVGREAVGIAVPADAVARAIGSARAASRCDGACKKKAVEDACLSLVSELARPEPNTTTIQRMLGEEIIAEHGITSHNMVVRHDGSIYTRFRSSPIATLSEAVARRLVGDVRSAGGVHPVETCAAIRTAKDAGGDSVTVPIALMDGQRQLTFAWDRARWRLADFPFEDDDDEAPPPAPPPAAKKKAPVAKKPVKK
jgi:serine protease Do